MADRREALLVVAPGRGTYGKAELGYLARHHADKAQLIAEADRQRAARAMPTVSELDGAAAFSPSKHGKGDAASPLIFLSGYADFLDIDRDRFEIAAITGNSMGWYTALACAGVLDAGNGFAVADAMGSHSGTGEPGGQLLMTIVGEDWRPDPALRAALIETADATGAAVSIDLGGMIVFAGPDAALDAFAKAAPPLPSPPLKLAGHGPFHTPLMHESSNRARAALPADWFGQPDAPMIDGRGAIWRRFATRPEAMWDYTFGQQILAAYDFATAIQVGVREFAPDRIVLLGPGDTLGGAIAQSLIAIQWRGLDSKEAFKAEQARDPFLVAMGRPDQRALVTRR